MKKRVMAMIVSIMLCALFFSMHYFIEAKQEHILILEAAPFQDMIVKIADEKHWYKTNEQGKVELFVAMDEKQVEVALVEDSMTYQVLPLRKEATTTYCYQAYKWQLKEETSLEITDVILEQNEFNHQFIATVILKQSEKDVLYALDAGAFQSSNQFLIRENGQHQVRVKDVDGKISKPFLFHVDTIKPLHSGIASITLLTSSNNDEKAFYTKNDMHLKITFQEDVNMIHSLHITSDVFTIENGDWYKSMQPFEKEMDVIVHVNKEKAGQQGHLYYEINEQMNRPSEKILIHNTNSNLVSSTGLIVYDAVLPTIEYEFEKAVYEDDLPWYTQLHDIKLNMNDEQSGLDKIIIYDKEDQVLMEKSFYNEKQATMLLPKEQIEKALHNGKVEMKIKVMDQAHNVKERLLTFGYDQQAPEITAFEIDQEKVNVSNELRIHHFKEAIKDVYVHIDDGKNSSKVTYLQYYLQALDGTKSEPKKVVVKKQNRVKIDVPKDFDGYLYAKAIDPCHLEEEIAYVHSEGIKTITQAEFEKEANLTFQYPQTPYEDDEHHPIYTMQPTIKVNLSNVEAGIKQVYYEVRKDNHEPMTKTMHFDSFKTNETFVLNDFQEDAAYEIYVIVRDSLGHEQIKTFIFLKDSEKPKVTYAFLDEGQTYHNDKRYVALNLEDLKVDLKHSEFYILKNDKEVKKEDYLYKITKTKQGYKVLLSFLEDGAYDVKMSVMDYAKQQTSIEVEPFVIDRIAPNLLTPKIKTYYANEVNFPLRIQEANFDNERIQVYVNKQKQDVVFQKMGDFYEGYVKISKDGIYDLEVTGYDLAGNELKKARFHFIVDTKKPRIELDEVKMCFTKDSRFTITVKDAYLKDSKAYVRARKQHQIMVLEKQNVWQGVSYTFENREYEQANDDCYEVIIEAQDHAGNKVMKRKTFYINRFGSFYQMPQLKDYNQQMQPLIIKEYNPTPLVDYALYIKKNGELYKVDTDDFRVYKQHQAMYTYDYVLSANLFKEDGVYDIFVYSKDLGNHKNANRLYEDGLHFCVDNQKPIIEGMNIASNTRYDEEKRYFHFFIQDQQPLKEVAIYVNHQKQAYQKEQQLYSIVLHEHKHPYDIVIEASDVAGNKRVKKYEKVSVNRRVKKDEKLTFHPALLLVIILLMSCYGGYKKVKKEL